MKEFDKDDFEIEVVDAEDEEDEGVDTRRDEEEEDSQDENENEQDEDEGEDEDGDEEEEADEEEPKKDVKSDKTTERLSKRAKAAEEEAEEVRRKLAEAQKQLSEMLKKTHDEKRKSLESKRDESKKLIETLEETRKEAEENGEYDKVAALTSRISDAKVDYNFSTRDLEALEKAAPEMETVVEDEKEIFNKEVKRLGERWASLRKDELKDSTIQQKMSQVARQLASRGLKENTSKFWDAMDECLDYILEEGNKQVDKKKPAKEEPKESRTKKATVSGSRKTPGVRRKERVALTKEQKRLANKWGLTEEQYAESLLEYQKQKGLR